MNGRHRCTSYYKHKMSAINLHFWPTSSNKNTPGRCTIRIVFIYCCDKKSKCGFVKLLGNWTGTMTAGWLSKQKNLISVLCLQWGEFTAQSKGVRGREQKGQPGSAGGRGWEASGREGEAGEDSWVSELEGEAPGVSRQVQSSGGPQGSAAEQRSKKTSRTISLITKPLASVYAWRASLSLSIFKMYFCIWVQQCQANIKSYFLCMTESDQRVKILKNQDGSPRNFTVILYTKACCWWTTKPTHKPLCI